jgi:hypothetical protein
MGIKNEKTYERLYKMGIKNEKTYETLYKFFRMHEKKARKESRREHEKFYEAVMSGEIDAQGVVVGFADPDTTCLKIPIDRRRVDSLKQRAACMKTLVKEDFADVERHISNELQKLSYVADILDGCRALKDRKKRSFAYMCRLFRRHDYMLASYYKRRVPGLRSKGHDYNTRFKIPDNQSSADSLQREDEYVKNLVHQDLASPEWLQRNCAVGSPRDMMKNRRCESPEIQNTSRLKRREIRKKMTELRRDDAWSYDRWHTLQDIDSFRDTPVDGLTAKENQLRVV